MLDKLKVLIKKYGIVKVSNDLGYKSINSIGQWIKNNRIPDKALINVRLYLKWRVK